MNISTLLYNHYGSALNSDMQFGLEIESITPHPTDPRPYTTIALRLTSYDGEANDIDELIFDQVYNDTGTSKRFNDLLYIIMSAPNGISRRDLLSRHKYTAVDLAYFLTDLPPDILLTERRTETGTLTRSGKPRYETRLFVSRL